MARAAASPARSQHFVQFYEDQAVLCEGVARYLSEGLREGEEVLAVTTAAHRDAFSIRMRALGIDVAAACASGQLTFFDAVQTLKKITREGALVDALFDLEVASDVVKRSEAHLRPVRVYGEMVELLWQQGDRKSALQLEGLWNELLSSHSLSVLCSYAQSSMYNTQAFLNVCAVHTHMMDETGHCMRV